MKAKYSYFLKIVLAAILAFNVLGTGVLTVLSMDHQPGGQPCFDTSASGSAGENLCLDYHLGLLHELSQAAPLDFLLALFVVSLAICFFTVLDICRSAANDLSYFRSRLRLQAQESLSRFYKQLGNWLAMFEKKDDASAAAWVQVGFGMP